LGANVNRPAFIQLLKTYNIDIKQELSKSEFTTTTGEAFLNNVLPMMLYDFRQIDIPKIVEKLMSEGKLLGYLNHVNSEPLHIIYAIRNLLEKYESFARFPLNTHKYHTSMACALFAVLTSNPDLCDHMKSIYPEQLQTPSDFVIKILGIVDTAQLGGLIQVLQKSKHSPPTTNKK
jgi:hypothetical protein